jgi:hypothetical protein
VVFVALILDVSAYHRLVAVFAHRACEVTVRPEFAAPQLLLDLRAPAEDLSRRQTLQHLNESRHAVGRHRLNEKMNMILVRPDLQKLHLVALRNLKAYLF